MIKIKIARTPQELDQVLAGQRNSGNKISLVPTMGALHDGHLSLIEAAKAVSDFIVVSIFVNPTQFAPGEDFETYPRTEERDIKQLIHAEADVVFLPAVSDLYPDGDKTSVKAGSAAIGLETDFRPHFFDGVVNVVDRLFKMVKPDLAIFGEKDFQQLQVIRQMVETTNQSLEIIGAPTIRDNTGLALSSRNSYLSEDEMVIAQKLNLILKSVKKIDDLEHAKTSLIKAGFDKIDYIDIKWNRVLAAVYVGKTRLIDNLPLRG